MRAPWILLPALLLLQATGYAQSGPQPPCGKQPVPPWPALDDPAVVKSWNRTGFGRDWKPPACTGWGAAGFSTLVTTVARFQHKSDAEGLLRHIGAISELTDTPYWSTTNKRWQTLIVEASVLTGRQNPQRRKDFTPDEMKQGSVLHFEQVDNLSGKAIYRLHVAEAFGRSDRV